MLPEAIVAFSLFQTGAVIFLLRDRFRRAFSAHEPSVGSDGESRFSMPDEDRTIEGGPHPIAPFDHVPVEELAETIEQDIAHGLESGLLGIIRFTDYQRLAAFDEAFATELRDKLTMRLGAATAPDRLISQATDCSFAIWFAGPGDGAALRTELEAITYALCDELEIGGRFVRPAIDAGSAAFPEDGGKAKRLINRASAAINLNHSDQGIHHFSHYDEAEAQTRFDTMQSVSRAIENDEFELHYQPVVNIAAGKIVGCEALVRWPRDGAELSPASFIPLLEETVLAERLGLWVLNTACQDAGQWTDPVLLKAKVAVNLSARQLRNPKLSETILRATRLHGFEAERLELELTETAAMEDMALSRRVFEQLRGVGIGISIDDFGTGYSSFSYLKNLPFDKLKIDREFVENVHERRDSQAICSAMIALGRGLGIAVLAEGVECEQEVHALAKMGCVLFQGYYFGRPMPKHAFAKIAADQAIRAKLLPPVARSRQKIMQSI